MLRRRKERAGRDKELPPLAGPFCWDAIRSSTLDWASFTVGKGREEGNGEGAGGGEIVRDVEVKWRS